MFKRLFNWLFRRNIYTLNRVRDNIIIREGSEELPLYVDCDAATIIPNLISARQKVENITQETPKEEQEIAARALSCAMFGKEQTNKLVEFYHGDFGCVVTICGMYFSNKNGLGNKITKAQKRFK